MGRRVLLVVLALAGCDAVFGTGVPPDAPPDAPPGPQSWATVASGMWHSCGIQFDGSLWCWGRNDVGQLAQDDLSANSESDVPRQVGDQRTWAQVTTLEFTTCAIDTSNRLFCWGNNRDEQISSSAERYLTAPTEIPGQWTSVATGIDHTCAIDVEGAAWCWGAGDAGQLGDGGGGGPARTRVMHAVPFVSIGAGRLFTCALDVNGEAWCWGVNSLGQLGDGTGAPNSVPTPVIGGHVFAQLAVGWNSACGRTTEGTLRCWGDNRAGQLGDGTVALRTEPIRVDDDAVSDWVDVVMGHDHTCARRASGEAWCWGGNIASQLADGALGSYSTSPVMVPLPAAVTAWRALGLGWRRTCLVDTDYRLWCVGHAGTGALGVMGEGSRRSPTLIGPDPWGLVSAGYHVTCAVFEANGGVRCWGDNTGGAVGDGTDADRSTPVEVMGAPTSPTSLSASLRACAVAPGGALSCWGSNTYHQISDDPLVGAYRRPFAVIGNTNFTHASGAFHTCAVATDDKIWCLGLNRSGECGNGPQQAQPPIKLSGDWTQVAAGVEFTCATGSGSATGTVSCWGSNSYGQLGRPLGTTSGPMAVQVSGLAGIEALSAGGQHICARSGFDLRCWGRNDLGQLGDMTGVTNFVPTVIPGTWYTVSAGDQHTCAIKELGGTGGSLWCWGANEHGQLGDGTLRTRTAPVQVGSATHWVDVYAGLAHTCAMDESRQLWCWGSNHHGELGDDTAWRAQLRQVGP